MEGLGVNRRNADEQRFLTNLYDPCTLRKVEKALKSSFSSLMSRLL